MRIGRRETSCGGAALLAALLAVGALWLYSSQWLLSRRIGSLRELRVIEVTWRGHLLGHWSDPARLREFRRTLPRRVAEMGGSRCGEGSVTLLHLYTAHRRIDLQLPVDGCAAINGHFGPEGTSFEAPGTLRLISTWIARDPARIQQVEKRFGRQSGTGESSYPWLVEQLAYWRGLSGTSPDP